jgi:sulfide dehydrogenase cytochrome subunit
MREPRASLAARDTTQCSAVPSLHLSWALLLLLTATLWPCGTEAAEAETARGAAIAYTCVTCHGPEGRSQGAMPSLTALTSADMIAALQAFRAETRRSTVMHRIARGLSEADMTAVAAYFATLPKR